MTWKTLFFRTSLQDLKRRGWCMILFFIVLFFSFPVKLLLGLQRLPIAELENYKAVYHYYTFGFISSKVTFPLLVGAGAVLAAMSGFSYLNFKKKVDFVHSMPIRRETLFASRFVSGFLLYFIPLILNLGFCLIISAVRGDFSTELLYSALWQLLFQFVYFLLFYGTAILAIVLIGNFVVSFLGIGVLYGYWSILWRVLHGFKSYFFLTYMLEYSEFHAYDPIGLWIQQMNGVPSGKTDALLGESFRQSLYFGSGWRVLLIAFILAVLVSGAAFLLFRIRPSESTGKTMIFRISEPILKVLLIIPSGLIMGMVMRSIATSYKTAWYSFGAVVGFLLSAVILEIIFRQDFKSFFQHKISAFVGGGFVIAITVLFQMDLLNYDGWTPKAADVESIGFSLPELESSRTLFEYPDTARYAEEEVFYDGELTLEHCRITKKEEVAQVLALVRRFARPCSRFMRDGLEFSYSSFSPDYGEDVVSSYGYNYRGYYKEQLGQREGVSGGQIVSIGDGIETKADERGRIAWICMHINYRLKNGKEVHRYYEMPYCEALVEMVEPIYASEAYKLAANPILDTENNKYAALILQEDFKESQDVFSRSLQKELIAHYREDVMGQTFRNALFEHAEATFKLSNPTGSRSTSSYKIYGSFENTLAFLAEQGYNLNADTEGLTIQDMTVMRHCRDDSGDVTITDYQEQQEILRSVKNDDLKAALRDFTSDRPNYAADYVVWINFSEPLSEAGEGRGEELYDKSSMASYQYVFTEVPDFVAEMFD